MVASAVQVAKRALLATMRAVALTFGMVLTCNRDSTDREVVTNFRKLALRVRPDRPGGSWTEWRQRCPGEGGLQQDGQWMGTLSLRFRCAATKVHVMSEIEVFLKSGL